MLELLALLQSRQRWSGTELADQLGVSGRTVRRDMDRLRSLGYPVAADRGVDGGYQLGSGARLPPLLVTGSEAVAIAVGLRFAARQPIAGMSEASIGALTKLVDVLPTEPRAELQAMIEGIEQPPGPMANLSIDVLTDLARACRDSQRTRFHYRTADGAAADRTVEPYQIVPMGHRWYLVAWDIDRDDWRTFRLDRISEPQVTKRRFNARTLPAPDAATFISQRLAALPATYRVEVDVAAPVAQIQPHLGPWGAATPAGDGLTRICIDADDLNWVVLVLAAVDADIERVDPPELLALLHRLGQRFTAVGAER